MANSQKPIEWLKTIAGQHKMAPSGVAIGTDKTMAFGQVLLLAGFRFVVESELTREEFLRRTQENNVRRQKQERQLGLNPGSTSGFTFDLDGSKPAAGTDEFVEGGAPPEFGHYYALRRLDP